jgi:hypothetical protein
VPKNQATSKLKQDFRHQVDAFVFVQKRNRAKKKNVMGAQANIVAHSPHVNKEFCV